MATELSMICPQSKPLCIAVSKIPLMVHTFASSSINEDRLKSDMYGVKVDREEVLAEAC